MTQKVFFPNERAAIFPEKKNMEKFHPSVSSRLETISKGYELLAAETLALETETNIFFKAMSNHLALFTKQDERQVLLEQENKLPLLKLKKRMKKLAAMGEATAVHFTTFSHVTADNREHIAAILSFRMKLLHEKHQLEMLTGDAELSHTIMEKLEIHFTQLIKDYRLCRHNMDECQAALSELQDMHTDMEAFC